MKADSTNVRDTAPAAAERLFVIIDGGEAAHRLVETAHAISRTMQLPWDAIYVETPRIRSGHDVGEASSALADAAALGASVHRLSGASVAAAVEQHLAPYAAPHVVLAVQPRGPIRRLRGTALIEELAGARPDAIFHAIADEPVRLSLGQLPRGGNLLRELAFSVLAVALTALGALVLRRFTGVTSLSVLFLFPVIAASARFGFPAAVLAALLSTALFNLLFLAPLATLDPWAVQSWLMGAVLVGVAVYTSWLTATLRGRTALSDRSAHESAALAAFAQELTRVSDWDSTAQVVCSELNRMFGVSVVVTREIDGALTEASAYPQPVAFDPLDVAARDWAWATGEVTGSGTRQLPDASWQFHPLKTSLGNLAIVGLARADGRNPIAAERQVMLATVIAQASLAHERLRLEDSMQA